MMDGTKGCLLSGYMHYMICHQICTCLYLWIKTLKYMHMHVWPNLALKCLLFTCALGFLRKVAEYIKTVTVAFYQYKWIQMRETSHPFVHFSSKILFRITLILPFLQRSKIIPSASYMSYLETEIHGTVYSECKSNSD